MPDNEKIYYHAFNLIPDFGPAAFHILKKSFPSLKEAWLAEIKELRQSGLNQKLLTKISQSWEKIDLEAEQEKLTKLDIKITTLDDRDYPKLLKEIYHPPALLYFKGELLKKDEFSLAVVGTRKISSYGKQITSEIVRPLVQNGLTIVSGLALGIDSEAHQAALEAGGRTIAVLGSGLDKIYPAGNRHLAGQIIEQGAILTEFPPGTEPLKHHFPIRNRIISGLSLGTLVIEAGESSGALITAKFSLDQNREVFAVPGSINHSRSIGTNNLIKRGAKLVSSYEDILEELNLNLARQYIDNQKIIAETQEEEILLKFLSREPTHIDKIIQLSKLRTNVVNACLTLMEMKGQVKNLGQGNYVLAR